MNDDYSKSLGRTLVESDLTNITTDILEATLDENLFEAGILKDIPIIRSIIGVGKTIISVQDYLFGKKILSFLKELSNKSTEERYNAISKINSNPKYEQSVGNKLLYLIDSTQDHITSKLIAKLFVAFIEEKLTYPEFCKASLIINKIDIYDLEEFLKLPDSAYGYNGTQKMGLEEIDNFLINAGLCTAESRATTVEDGDTTNYWSSNDRYLVRGGETIIYRTLIGTKIYNILSKNS